MRCNQDQNLLPFNNFITAGYTTTRKAECRTALPMRRSAVAMAELPAASTSPNDERCKLMKDWVESVATEVCDGWFYSTCLLTCDGSSKLCITKSILSFNVKVVFRKFKNI
jgi:hypothetical protein